MIGETAPDIVAHIDALLPQTQCTRCGYAGCKPYAAAIAGGEAQINQCPPGGSATILALAGLLDRPVQPLNPAYGSETPPRVAWIDESRCIGCARCLAPCPVDAIVGAAKYMHTVLIDRCTGANCACRPVRSIASNSSGGPPPPAGQAALNRERFEAHTARLLNRAAERQRELDTKKAAAPRGAGGES